MSHMSHPRSTRTIPGRFNSIPLLTAVLDELAKNIKTCIFVTFCRNYNINALSDIFGWEKQCSQTIFIFLEPWPQALFWFYLRPNPAPLSPCRHQPKSQPLDALTLDLTNWSPDNQAPWEPVLQSPIQESPTCSLVPQSPSPQGGDAKLSSDSPLHSPPLLFHVLLFLNSPSLSIT